MTGMLLVSHSRKLVNGLADLTRELSGSVVPIETAGGEDSLGVTASMVASGITSLLVQGVDGILILGDLGSAFISAETAIDLVSSPTPVHIVDAPLVEGTIAAAMTLSTGAAIQDAISAATEAYTIRKR
ncbi:hypothetical protein BXT84_10480 [Sulfobacillus thermotolerans]|uniref:PTS EIIA type-4 domain-containing protein n=1 Tax=Sulfobacillus thermotolerans TaxID=338644 RepID=A0ABM6RSC5_9FIRM|nr:hypothetical protein BXT84_10480 [Sulfobacillus thermotolerans]